LTNAKEIMSRYIKRLKVETKNRQTEKQKEKERQKEIMSRNIMRLKVET
jgi:hypothetical protein